MIELFGRAICERRKKMPKLSQARKLEMRKRELVEALKYTKKLRQTVLQYQKILHYSYVEGKINYLDYQAAQRKVFQGRSVSAWIEYYDQCITYYQKELSYEGRLYKQELEKPKHILTVVLALLFIGLLSFGTYTGYDTVVEFLTEENTSVVESSTELVSEETVEQEAGSEANESAADTGESITSAGILPVEEIEEAVDEKMSEETLAQVPEENISKVPDLEQNLSEEMNFTESIEEEEEEVNFTKEIKEDNRTKPSKEQIENLSRHILPVENISIENLTLENNTINNVSEIFVQEEIKQYGAVLGQPVRWNKTLTLSHESTVSLELPQHAELVSVHEIIGEEEIPIDFSLIKVNSSGVLVDVRSTDLVAQEAVPLSFFGGIFSWIGDIFSSLTGLVIFEETPVEENISLVIEEPVQEVVIEYLTEAALAYEENTSTGKRITISSTTHYENILSFTSLPEVEEENIQLYWIVNGTRQSFSFTPYDTNGNDLIDSITWITPHLSNESFEIDLLVLNIQSYPTVGGNWTVNFNTTGNADLRIQAYNGTHWSLGNSTRDLDFLEVVCGEASQTYTWVNDSVLIQNYSCTETGREVSRVLSSGVHTLQFKFGNITRYAYNDADYSTCPDPSGNVTVSVNTVWSNTTFTCNYITITSNAILTLNSTGAGNTTINITAYEINITSGAAISVGSTGFLANQGPGGPLGTASATDSGAGHGGLGGIAITGGSSDGTIYDSITYPLQMGSGGDSANSRTLSRGAGAIHFNVTGTLIIEGAINASAALSTGGGGAGGALLINVTTINGTGSILAKGGEARSSNDGGGAGGRIALYYKEDNFLGSIDASGGNTTNSGGRSSGAAGTIYKKFINQSNGELLITNNNITLATKTILNTTVFGLNVLDNLTVTNKSHVVIDVPLTINNTEFVMGEGTILTLNTDFNASRVTLMNISGSMQVTANYTFNQSLVMILFNGGNLSHKNNTNLSGIAPYILNLSVRNFTLLSGARIDVSISGYGITQGPGGVSHSGAAEPGAGYGGQGGSDFANKIGAAYGNALAPLDVGSGGEGVAAGGAGAVFLNVSDTLIIEGIINASALGVTADGGGSGGSVFINATSFIGNGSIFAKGGSADTTGVTSSDGAGGGGRIAIYYGNYTFNGSFDASGGNSSDLSEVMRGGAGTIFLKARNHSYGELIIENRNVSKAAMTPLNTTFFNLSTLDNLTVTNKSYVLIESPLTINNTYFDLGEGTFLDLRTDFNAPRLANVTLAGSIEFTANYSFNQSMIMRLYSSGNLSHRNNSNATGASVYILNLTMRNLTIDVGASIDVAQQGYASEQGPGASSGGVEEPGAGYGADGGTSAAIIGRSYGNLTTPLHLGSGGDTSLANGKGAGVIFLNITDTLVVDGILNASAESAASDGGGSGGSIYLIARTLGGAGSILARGGSSTGTTTGAGSGGRIALYYLTRTFSGEINVTAGNQSAGGNLPGAGTFFICQSTASVNCTGIGGSSVRARNGALVLDTEYTINTSIIVNKTINVSWSRSSVNWTDMADKNTIAIHNLTGLSASANYTIRENATTNSTQISNTSGALKFFNFTLSSQIHDINVYNTSVADAGTVSISIDDGTIAFGSGYFDASCTAGYSVLNSNISRSCWINTTTYPGSEDVHLITNNGTANANITASLQIQDAETFFCGSSGGCALTDTALIAIDVDNNEANSCVGLAVGFNNLSTYNTNRTAPLCNALSSADASNQIKTRVMFQAPRDTTVGAKTLVIVYESIAA